MIVEKGSVKAQLPVSKNIIKINGQEKEMKGLVVLSKNGSTYVPQEAVDLFNASVAAAAAPTVKK